MKKSSSAIRRSGGGQLPGILALVVAILAFGTPNAAQAQTAPPAPVRESFDGNRVDLFTGKLTATGPVLVLGSDGNTLSYYRWSKGAGWSDSLSGYMNLSGSVMTVSLGPVSDSFTVSGSTYTSTEGNGATLTLSGGIYSYRQADGTVARFDPTTANDYVPYSNNGQILDTVSPNGEKRTYGYESITYCKTVNTRGICTLTGHAEPAT